MGVEIIKVPIGFEHPVDEDGDAIPGAHYEALYYIDDALKIGYQLYENVTEGTPQSPIFADRAELQKWLEAEGVDKSRITFLMEHGHAPSFIIRG